MRLLDLQITRVASPALDINYMIYSSVIGQHRRDFLPVLLAAYESSFNNVIACGNQKPLYNFDQLKKEFYKRNKFGLLMGLMLIPMMVATTEEVIDFNSVTDEEMEEFVNEQKEKNAKAMKTNPLLRPRLLDMIDEMVERGVV